MEITDTPDNHESDKTDEIDKADELVRKIHTWQSSTTSLYNLVEVELYNKIKTMTDDEIQGIYSLMENIDKFKAKLSIIGVEIKVSLIVKQNSETRETKIIPTILRINNLGLSTFTFDCGSLNNGDIKIVTQSIGRNLRNTTSSGGLAYDLTNLNFNFQEASFVSSMCSLITHNYEIKVCPHMNGPRTNELRVVNSNSVILNNTTLDKMMRVLRKTKYSALNQLDREDMLVNLINTLLQIVLIKIANNKERSILLTPSFYNIIVMFKTLRPVNDHKKFEAKLEYYIQVISKLEELIEITNENSMLDTRFTRIVEEIELLSISIIQPR
jgi:hypothetical protein